jgi:hypothetical protein
LKKLFDDVMHGRGGIGLVNIWLAFESLETWNEFW